MTKIYIEYDNNILNNYLNEAISVLENTNTYIRAPYDFSERNNFVNIISEIRSIKNDLKTSSSWFSCSKKDYSNFDSNLKVNVNRIPKTVIKKRVSIVK